MRTLRAHSCNSCYSWFQILTTKYTKDTNKAVQIAVVLSVVLDGSVALAHRLDADYRPQADCIRIEFFFADGSSAGDLDVAAEQPGRPPIVLGRTDARGAVLFRPPTVGEWKIIGRGAGHANTRNPVIIPPEIVRRYTGAQAVASTAPGESLASSSGANPESDTPERATSSRGRFPWIEAAISLGFIGLLTLATLWMMRRSARFTPKPTELQEMAHEVAHLQATISQLQREIAELKAEQDAHSR